MRYKNTKTQAVIETACVIRGGDWVLVDEQPKNTDSSRKKASKKTKKEDE